MCSSERRPCVTRVARSAASLRAIAAASLSLGVRLLLSDLEMTKPPSLPTLTGTEDKLRKELSTFFIALGLLLLIPTYFTLTGLKNNPPPLWETPRHLAIGVPLAILSFLHLASGTLLLTSRNRYFGIIGALASTLITVFFFAFMFSATGAIPINLISIVVSAIPIVVWSRAYKFLSASALN